MRSPEPAGSVPLDLVVVGNLIVDDIVYDNGETRMGQPGGAALYCGLAAQLWNLRVGLVSLAGSDFPSPMLSTLAQRGVEMAGVRDLQSPGLRTWLLYEGRVRRVVHRMEGATHRQASPSAADIPPTWRPRAIHLAPMPFDIQMDLVRDLSRRFSSELLLSLDPFELMTSSDLPRWRELLSAVDLFFLSEDEMSERSTREHPEPALRALLQGKLGAVFYKQGSNGGLIMDSAKAPARRWQPRSSRVVDTTGAGDAFACGVLAGLLQDQPLDRALCWGVVAASFAIEDRGVEGLLSASPATARQRLDSWFSS